MVIFIIQYILCLIIIEFKSIIYISNNKNIIFYIVNLKKVNVLKKILKFISKFL